MSEQSYESIVESLRGLPMTWYPQILTEVVTEAHRANVFVDGGASRFVAIRERDLGGGSGRDPVLAQLRACLDVIEGRIVLNEEGVARIGRSVRELLPEEDRQP